MLGEAVIAHPVADQFRADLKEAGVGDGHCAFSVKTPAFVPKSDLPRVRVRLEHSLVFLGSIGAEGAAASGGAGRETHSLFGGLWIVDRYDWMERLAQKHRTGAISDALSEEICRFVRDGYLVIEGAVPAKTVDRLNAEIDRVWTKPPPGLLIETFEPDGQMRYIPPDLALRESTKLLDLYAVSAVAPKRR